MILLFIAALIISYKLYEAYDYKKEVNVLISHYKLDSRPEKKHEK